MGSEEPRWWELGGGGGTAARQLVQSCAVKVTITAEQRSGSQHSRPRDPRAAQTAGPWFWFHYQFGRRDYKQQIVVTLFFLPLFVLHFLSLFFHVSVSAAQMAVLYRPSWQRTEGNLSLFLRPLFHEYRRFSFSHPPSPSRRSTLPLIPSTTFTRLSPRASCGLHKN